MNFPEEIFGRVDSIAKMIVNKQVAVNIIPGIVIFGYSAILPSRHPE